MKVGREPATAEEGSRDVNQKKLRDHDGCKPLVELGNLIENHDNLGGRCQFCPTCVMQEKETSSDKSFHMASTPSPWTILRVKWWQPTPTHGRGTVEGSLESVLTPARNLAMR